ncbi:MAG: VanZ family protein [Candidatus Pacebacteria bacterium]|nr:VanZ family protein [Candidatus Paceibacterota bacterium]
MYKRLVAALILLAYIAILLKVMVFKDMPMVTIGHIMLNFGGIDAGHPANFVPFKTIIPYLFGFKGLVIAGINLVGNIALLVPVGFIVPLIYRGLTRKTLLVLAVASGLIIEILQVILRVGMFDIDDVLLNALGVLIGYLAHSIYAKLMASKYKLITIAAIVVILAPVAYAIVVYPKVRLSAAPQNVLRGSQSDQAASFTWKYAPHGSLMNMDGIAQTNVYLVATYSNGSSERRLIDTVPMGCNDLPEKEIDSIPNSSVAQCYGAGAGYRYKVTMGEGLYLVQRKAFEEALPNQKSTVHEYETVAEFAISAE